MINNGYIVIIDDDEVFLEYLKQLLISYFGFSDKEILIFTHYDEVALKKIKIDLLFLDIELESKLNGIDICKILKCWDEDIVVIYCTNYNKYTKQAWKTSALYYIDKNDLDADLKETRSKLLQNNFRQMTYIDLFGKKVNIKKVTFVESSDRKMILHCLGGGEIVISKILKEGLQLLSNYAFVQSHKSFAINTDFILYLTNDTVVLRDMTPVPMGRKYKKQIEDIFRGNV